MSGTAGSGVIYFNKGTKCLARLAVSAHSLRAHYSGPAALLMEGAAPGWFEAAMRRLDVRMVPVDTRGVHPLVFKTRLHRHTPFGHSLFLDADTLVLGSLDELLEPAPAGFAVGRFADWRTEGRTMAGRIRQMEPAAGREMVDKALAYGPAVNTGVFAFSTGSGFLEPWAALTEKAAALGCSRIPDELACQLLLPSIPHGTLDPKFGESVRFGRLGADTRVVHYHGRKHAAGFPACGEWKRHFWEMLGGMPRAHRDALLGDTLGDRQLDRYIRRGAVTFVTAADRAYLPKLKANFDGLASTPGMAGEPWICYVNGIPTDSPELDFLRGRCGVVPWDCEAGSQRERMLACFVRDAPNRVRTPHWVKVDADVRASATAFKLPAGWRSSALTAHRWHYTKPGAWLRRLEDWAAGVPDLRAYPGLFTAEELAEADSQLRYGHPRVASFICAHDTEFTRGCAWLAESYGLPVPSHDTFFWYCAARMRKPVLRINFKRMGFHP